METTDKLIFNLELRLTELQVNFKWRFDDYSGNSDGCRFSILVDEISTQQRFQTFFAVLKVEYS